MDVDVPVGVSCAEIAAPIEAASNTMPAALRAAFLPDFGAGLPWTSGVTVLSPVEN